MNYNKTTNKSYYLSIEDLKETIELVKLISDKNVKYSDENTIPTISISFFNGITKKYQDLESVSKLKNTADNPITNISVLSPFGKNSLDFFFNSVGVTYMLNCSEEEIFYFYQSKAESLISSIHEDKIYNYIFSTGVIFFFIYLLIQSFISLILVNIIETSDSYELVATLLSTTIYFLFLWRFMWREKRIFPMSFFLIGRGVERREKNIKLRKSLLTSVPITIVGFILQLIV